jgi:lipopolysaccharide transport system permease protein
MIMTSVSSARAEAPLRSLLRFRWLILEFVIRDLRLRYRGSIGGLLWTLLNPVVFMGIYTLVFGVFLNVGTAHYPVFLLSGLVPWSWFQMSISQGTTSIQDGRMYVGKTVFPTEVLVAVPVLSNMINFALSIPLLFLIELAFGIKPGLSLVLLPVIVAIQCTLTIGILLIVATYNVFFRDFQQLVGIAVMFVFYLNPIFYPLDRIPPAIQHYAVFDPITPLILAYQDLFYRGTWPSPVLLAYSATIAIIAYAIGQFIFNRHHDSFAEYL